MQAFPKLQEALEDLKKGTLPSQQWWNDFKKAPRPSNDPNAPSLYRWGFWNIVEKATTHEVYSYLKHTLGVSSIYDNWNAAEAAYLLFHVVAGLSAGPDGLRTFSGGMSELTHGLVRDIKAKGVPIERNMRLAELQRDGNDFVLLFQQRSKGGPSPNTELITVRAGTVVLAMPPAALAAIDPGDSVFDSPAIRTRNFQRAIRRMAPVRPIPAFKLALHFSEEWWQQDVPTGYAATDFPLRQVHYGVGNSADPTQPVYKKAVIAAYADATSATFWGPLARMKAGHHRVTRKEQNDEPPDSLLVEEGLRELRLLHPSVDSDQIEAVWSSFRDWTVPPYGGAWHAWNPGVDTSKAIPQMRRPFGDDLDVFVVGEAFSVLQGWIEGAFCSAERLLQDHLGVAPPTWLKPDYNLGP